MEFSFFEIKNFRGIGHIRLQLDGSPKGKPVTISPETKVKFEGILTFLSAKLAEFGTRKL